MAHIFTNKLPNAKNCTAGFSLKKKLLVFYIYIMKLNLYRAVNLFDVLGKTVFVVQITTKVSFTFGH